MNMKNKKAAVGGKGNPTISEFIAQRWADAKTALRGLDPEFVSKIEGAVRLNKVGLVPPWPSSVKPEPRARLLKEWQALAEALFELEAQTDYVKIAAIGLSHSAHKAQSAGEAGKEAHYHFRSWCIHVAALAERVDFVIGKTVQVYMKVGYRKLLGRYKNRVEDEVKKIVDRQRNEYLHGDQRSWASGITEDKMWELGIAVGLLPRTLLEEFEYPVEGAKVQSGKRAIFEALTEEALNRLGRMLHDLEVELGLSAKLPESENVTT